MFIDSHVHYAHKRFDSVRDALLPQLHSNGLEAAVEAAITMESNLNIQETLEPYPWIYYSVGLHPSRVEAGTEKDVECEQAIMKALKNPKVVAVGETGLDYHRLSYETDVDKLMARTLKRRQEYWFDKLIALAQDKDLPLIIHTREAHAATLCILQEWELRKKPGVVHCFRGDAFTAKEYLSLGFYLGIGGALTFDTEGETREAVKEIPLERILLETDSPFLVPVGSTESKNTSANIPVVAKLIGELKGVSTREVMEITKKKYEGVVWN